MQHAAARVRYYLLGVDLISILIPSIMRLVRFFYRYLLELPYGLTFSEPKVPHDTFLLAVAVVAKDF